MRKKERNKLILERLEETYKGQGTALHYTTPFELLVAVILSAQCTDERVNIVTKRLFPKYNTPEKLGALTLEQMEALIHDCGLYHPKHAISLLRAENLLMTSIPRFLRR